MDIVRLMLLSRQMKNRRHEKNNMVTGIPPLTFTANKKGLLKNYRIYGNTETLTRSYSGTTPLSFPIVDGAVSNYRVYGQTSRNLFDYSTVTTGYRIIWVTGQPAPDATATISDYIAVNSGTYAVNSRVFVACYDSSKNYLGVYSANGYVKDYSISVDYIVLNSTCSYIRIFSYNISGVGSNTISQTTMLNVGSTALPYEPYGESVGDLVTDSQSEHYGEYAIPITNNSETANIYLDEPLTKSGNNADYIDYAEQKRHNADGTSEDVTLPALPAQSSTNSLSVGTTIQPSSVAVDVDEVVSCGDKVTDSQNVNYGKYKIPVTLTADSAETTDIYLDTPLAKSGDIADYIDYAAQKRHNSDGTESSVTLPEIAVTAGTNTFTIGTEVQPSRVELTGRIKEAQTNGSGNT
jgi:hypothetical protein